MLDTEALIIPRAFTMPFTTSRRLLTLGVASLPLGCSIPVPMPPTTQPWATPDEDFHKVSEKEGILVGIAVYARGGPNKKAGVTEDLARQFIFENSWGLGQSIPLTRLTKSPVFTEEGLATVASTPFALKAPAGRCRLNTVVAYDLTSWSMNRVGGAVITDRQHGWVPHRVRPCEFTAIAREVTYIGRIGFFEGSATFPSAEERDAVCPSIARGKTHFQPHCRFAVPFFGSRGEPDLALIRQRFPVLADRYIQTGLPTAPAGGWRRWPEVLQDPFQA